MTVEVGPCGDDDDDEAVVVVVVVREGLVEIVEGWEPHRFGDDGQYRPTSRPIMHSFVSSDCPGLWSNEFGTLLLLDGSCLLLVV